jgi:membrane protein implicated in regulation of membrane protease activity
VALILSVILSFFVPWPWNLVVILAGITVEAGEIVWGRRLARRLRPKTGAEAMIGKAAIVVEACRPNGRVRVDGELWDAHCAVGAAVGEPVRITAVEKLTLEVAPARSSADGKVNAERTPR